MAHKVPATGGSLSLRLLAFAGGSIAVALALAWAVLGALFERHAERQLQSELERQGIALIAAVSLNPQGLPQLDRQPADPRFERPASGLYWLLTGPGGELRSRSLWDGRIALPEDSAAEGWVRVNSAGPFEPEVMIAVRTVQPDPGGAELRVAVAADRAPLMAARTAFERETAIFLAALWALLALAAWIQVRLGLRPLAAIRDELNSMSQAADARLDVSAHPAEIRPLTTAINHVADQRAEDIVRARQRAKDLAHALKTPLTALRLQVEALAPEAAQGMMQSLALVSGAVEGELARTGLNSEAGTTEIKTVVERILAVVSRTPAGRIIAFRNEVPPDLHLPMNDDTALETFGALIENAARHAHKEVVIAGGVNSGLCWITIADDGLGIPQGLRPIALERGGRLDERSGSHGLGLSIAQDFVTASGGKLALEDAGSGGLAVRIVWPVIA
jgi:signal transduction histidine kinase